MPSPSLRVHEVTSMPYSLLSNTYSVGGVQWRDRTLLDIGSGCSDFTAVLREQGADAYAVDPAYADLPWLISQSTASNNELSKSTGIVLGDSKFHEHFNAEPQAYIAASADSLPFAERTIDRIYNNRLLAVTVDSDPDFSDAAVIEMLRVLKVGGAIVTAGVIPPNQLRTIYGGNEDSIYMSELDAKLKALLQRHTGKLGKVARTNPRLGGYVYTLTKGRK